MLIPYSKLPAIVNAIESAVSDQKKWIAMDARIQAPEVNDLHFFASQTDALNFREFNERMQKNIILLPAIITLDTIHETVGVRLNEGDRYPNVSLDPKDLMEHHHQYEMMLEHSRLMQELDNFDWSKVFYDPMEANTEAETFEDKIAFNRLESLVEEMSVLAQTGDKAQAAVEKMLVRYWKGQPMEIQIQPVLQGKFPGPSTLKLSPLNIQTMNMENLKYLKENIKYTGFGEALYPELEKNIEAKKPEFQLHFTTQIGNKSFDAVLDFRKSNTSDMYFFNRYKATIEKSNGEKLAQSFSINKGKGVTAKEAFNLLQGRAVYHDLTNSKGEPYKAWIQLDFDKKDDKGNYVVNKYNDNYGYDLRESVAKFPVKELDGAEAEKNLLRSLERGNAQSVTFDMGGTEQKFIITANPVYKTLNVYDEKFVMQKHENLPKMGSRESVSQKQSDTQQQSSQKLDQKQGLKNETTQKNNALVSKKRTGKKKGIKI